MNTYVVQGPDPRNITPSFALSLSLFFPRPPLYFFVNGLHRSEINALKIRICVFNAPTKRARSTVAFVEKIHGAKEVWQTGLERSKNIFKKWTVTTVLHQKSLNGFEVMHVILLAMLCFYLNMLLLIIGSYKAWCMVVIAI